MLKKISIFLLSFILVAGFNLTASSSTKVKAATFHSGYVLSKYVSLDDPFAFTTIGGVSNGTVKLDASISTLNVMDCASPYGNIIDSLPNGYTVTALSDTGIDTPPWTSWPQWYHIIYSK